MGVKAAVETLRQAEILKQQIAEITPKDFASPKIIALQKELQHLYRHIFLIDINYGLENKIDQDLWNVGFKLGISSLQELIKYKQCDASQKSEYSAILCWILSGASGFFLSLLNATCGTRKDVLETSTELSYLSQYCLVHLGDLARYQGHKEQAQNYYEHAIKLAPIFGHAYNQLALLEPRSSSLDSLKICSLYCRAACAPQSFTPAHNNLMRLLEEYKTFEFSMLTTSEDYISAFLKQLYYVLNISIYDMNIEYPKTLMLNETKCIEMFILITYAYDRIIDATKEFELSKDEQILKRIILKLCLHLFTILHRNENPHKSTYIILSWIMRNEHLMLESAFIKAQKDLQNCFQVLTNSLSEKNCEIKDDEGILKEESELLTYLPYGLSNNTSVVSENVQADARNNRILKWTKHFLNVISNSSDSCTKDTDENLSNDHLNDSSDTKSVISRSTKNETKVKPKTKTRTNVAMQAILRMQQNSGDNNITSAYVSASQSEEKVNVSNHGDDLTTEENESSENAIKSLYSLPIETPPLPPIDWLDDYNTNLERNDLQKSTLFSNLNYLEDNNSSYNSLITGIGNDSSSMWSQGASYSLFSGHSPLAKLLEDQKTKHDVIK